MADWEDSGRSYRATGPVPEREHAGHEGEHPFEDRTDEWRRIRDTAYAGVPGQDEGIEGPGPYYPEYQISGEVIHPGYGYQYEQFEPGLGPPRREWAWERAEQPFFGQRREWSEAHRVSWQRPSRRWSEAPPGWRRISRGHAVGHPPEAWIRPGLRGPTMSRPGGYYGRAPKGYVRSDERIREDVCDWFLSTDLLDPSDIEVSVDQGEVVLSGTVDSRRAKRCAEDIAADVLGVRDVHNRLRIRSSPTLERT
jgi:hypothetical protein